jgi:hypothetical protein
MRCHSVGSGTPGRSRPETTPQRFGFLNDFGQMRFGGSLALTAAVSCFNPFKTSPNFAAAVSTKLRSSDQVYVFVTLFLSTDASSMAAVDSQGRTI